MASVEAFVYRLINRVHDHCKVRRITRDKLVRYVKDILTENYSDIEIASESYHEPRTDTVGFRYGIVITFGIRLDTLRIFTIYLIRDPVLGRYVLTEQTNRLSIQLAMNVGHDHIAANTTPGKMK